MIDHNQWIKGEMMDAWNLIKGTCLAGLVLVLTSCSSGTSSPALGSLVPPPTSGNYAWLLKAQGSTGAPQYGLSFIHPSNSTVEFAIEPSTAAISDVKVVSSGTVTAGQTISNITPYALLYIVAGEVRRISLVANGIAPATQVQKASNVGACKFIFDANDYATPDQSRFIVSTKGADNICGTGDDGQVEVALNATGGVSYSPVVNTVFGMLRDPTTLIPRGWILGNGVYYWANASFFALRTIANPLLTRVVTANHNTAVGEDNTQLAVWQVTTASTVVETLLGAALTAGTGWQPIGFDANNFYVYRNDTATSTWTVLKINIATPAAALLTTGPGAVYVASMGTSVLYVTVLGTSANTLLTINKSAGTQQPLESNPTTTLSVVLTSASGVHQRWRITSINSNPSYTIEMINEVGNTILYTAADGFPMAMQDPTTVNLKVSENRNRFLFVTGYGYTSRQFGDSTLVVYDAPLMASAPRTLGTIPGTAAFSGANPVFASVIGASTDFTAGFAVPVISGTFQDTSTKVFSVDIATPNSLKYTTSKQ